VPSFSEFAASRDFSTERPVRGRLLPQPATRALFSPQERRGPKSRVHRHFLARQRQYTHRERSGNWPFQGHIGQKYPAHMMVLTLLAASRGRRFSLVDSDKKAKPAKELAVAYRPVDSLEPYARNSRTHSNARGQHHGVWGHVADFPLQVEARASN
jgi:hypothetical protein